MFKEILKITPKLDTASLSTMERLLNSRFARVSKKFGKGVISAMKATGWVALAGSIIDKLINPLKEVQEAVDKTLNGADDTVTNAEQFNSTPGELFKLQKFAQAQGLDAESLNQLLVKFQGAVAEANADKTKQTSVREFAGETNSVKGFFEFIQALNKMERGQQVLVQQEVFGEKQTLKMADFLRSDFQKLAEVMKLKDASAYDPALTKLAGLNDLQEALKASREAGDVFTKGRIINKGMVTQRAAAEQAELNRENERISNFKSLQSISETSTKIFGLLEKGLFMLGDVINRVVPMINDMVAKVSKIADSGWIRGIFGGSKKDK